MLLTGWFGWGWAARVPRSRSLKGSKVQRSHQVPKQSWNGLEIHGLVDESMQELVCLLELHRHFKINENGRVPKMVSQATSTLTACYEQLTYQSTVGTWACMIIKAYCPNPSCHWWFLSHPFFNHRAGRDDAKLWFVKCDMWLAGPVPRKQFESQITLSAVGGLKVISEQIPICILNIQW